MQWCYLLKRTKALLKLFTSKITYYCHYFRRIYFYVYLFITTPLVNNGNTSAKDGKTPAKDGNTSANNVNISVKDGNTSAKKKHGDNWILNPPPLDTWRIYFIARRLYLQHMIRPYHLRLRSRCSSGVKLDIPSGEIAALPLALVIKSLSGIHPV